MDIPDGTSDRRRFLAIGGAASAAVVLAACGKSKSNGATGETTSTTASPSARDIALLQTASSLEEFEVAVYKRALDGGLIKTPGLVDSIKVLQAQHQAHAGLIEGHTSRLGGQPVTAPSAALLGQFQSRLDAASDENAVLRLAFDLAQLTTATYQAAIGNVSDKQLNLVLMSITGVEARHAAILGLKVGQTLPAASFSKAG